MADDTTPQHFFPKNEQKGALIEALHRASSALSVEDVVRQSSTIEPSQATTTTAEHRLLFTRAMADQLKRRIAFNVVERNCRARFGQGEEGVKLYFQLLEYVQMSNVSEAVDEFRRRFAPMVDQELLRATERFFRERPSGRP
jgi:hypothetical protein